MSCEGFISWSQNGRQHGTAAGLQPPGQITMAELLERWGRTPQARTLVSGPPPHPSTPPGLTSKTAEGPRFLWT